MCTLDDLAKNLERGRESDVIILDFSKAFDCVNHRKLLHKLSSYGINKQILIWIKSFLESKTRVVVVESQDNLNLCWLILDFFKVVHWGLSLFYYFFINDTAVDCVKHSTISLFVDDIFLYRPISCKSDVFILQRGLDSLLHWRHDMKFNAEDSNLMSFGRTSTKFLYVTTSLVELV